MAEHGPSIQFLGAAGTVTGSKHLLRAKGGAVLLDFAGVVRDKHGWKVSVAKYRERADLS